MKTKGITKTIISLFEEGKTKKEIIEMGYKRNTVHQVINIYLRNKKCTLSDTPLLVS